MKKCVFIFGVVLLGYIRSAHTRLQMVWLKDVTTRISSEKRSFSDLDHPDELTFNLRRGSGDFTLNLKRNYDIDPNADIYFARKSKDGRSVLVKTPNYGKEDVAYYHDMENGAFMTVRCVKRSNKQCDREIYGNIHIGNSSYDLRPAETDVASRNLFEGPDPFAKRYVLQDQGHIQRENSIENKDKSRQLKKNYYVKIAVLIDPGTWRFYSSMVSSINPITKGRKVKKRIQESFSHIMNGVNLRYKGIQDSSISISVILSRFIYFKDTTGFIHNQSKVSEVFRRNYIDVNTYIEDLSSWDKDRGKDYTPLYDHAMLFTRYNLYDGDIKDTCAGIAFDDTVCDVGRRLSIVQERDYFSTTLSAAHELGHNLGARHDGENNATACKSEDLFIMTTIEPKLDPARPLSRNLWIFSNCSVEAFKRNLYNRACVTHPGLLFDEQQYKEYVTKEPGEVYTPDYQCKVSAGPRSVYCGPVPVDSCYLKCTNPDWGYRMETYFGAARGTQCGKNMWCIEGRCVSKLSDGATATQFLAFQTRDHEDVGSNPAQSRQGRQPRGILWPKPKRATLSHA